MESVKIQQQTVYIPQPEGPSAIPLQGLNMSAAPVDCPLCGVRAYTRATFEVGNQTQLISIVRTVLIYFFSIWGAVLCLLTLHALYSVHHEFH